MRGEERWVAACMRSALGDVEVRQHDDGSGPSMHDLDLWRSNRWVGAVEVTAAADRESIELWNLVNGSDNRWIEPDLVGGWLVTLSPNARAKRLRAELPALLADLESIGLAGAAHDLRRIRSEKCDASGLGIISTHQSATNHAGSIYLTIELPAERSGGLVADTGDGLAEWIGQWTAQPDQVHNIEKLRRSGADERHLFILIPGFTTAPFTVADLLIRPHAPLPDVAPTLPSGITHVWAMSTWSSGQGFCWSSKQHWMRFPKIFDLRDS